MKHPSSKITKHRRNPFDTGLDTQEDDLLLTDVKVMPDEAGLIITPLDHLLDDQDDIDRLLVNTGFDNDPIPPGQDAFAVIEDIKPDDNTPKFDASEPHLAGPVAGDLLQADTETGFQVDSFISTYLAMRPTPHADGPEMAANGTPAGAIIGPATTETAAPEPVAIEGADNGTNSIDIAQQAITGHFAGDDTETSPRYELAAEPKNTGKPQGRHQSNVIAYFVLAIACTTLMSTIALGMMVYNMKTEVEKLADLLAIVKEDMEINNANQDIEPIENSARKPSKQ